MNPSIEKINAIQNLNHESPKAPITINVKTHTFGSDEVQIANSHTLKHFHEGVRKDIQIDFLADLYRYNEFGIALPEKTILALENNFAVRVENLKKTPTYAIEHLVAAILTVDGESRVRYAVSDFMQYPDFNKKIMPLIRNEKSYKHLEELCYVANKYIKLTNHTVESKIKHIIDSYKINDTKILEEKETLLSDLENSRIIIKELKSEIANLEMSKLSTKADLNLAKESYLNNMNMFY